MHHYKDAANEATDPWSAFAAVGITVHCWSVDVHALSDAIGDSDLLSTATSWVKDKGKTRGQSNLTISASRGGPFPG